MWKEKKNKNDDADYKNVKMIDIKKKLKLHKEILTLLNVTKDIIMIFDDKMKKVDDDEFFDEISIIISTNTLSNEKSIIKKKTMSINRFNSKSRKILKIWLFRKMF